MKSRLKLDIGDRTKLVLNGDSKELEIVDVTSGGKKSAGKFSFSLSVQDILGRGYLEKVDITLPDGQTIECRPLQPTF